jgi:hypothetical protein
LPTRIGLFEFLEDLDIPELGISAIGLGFYVVPPHRFLTFRKGPGGFAGHGASLTTNTAICVKDKGKLLFWMLFFIGVKHISTQLPVINFTHPIYLL